MSIEEIERQIHDAYLHLAESATIVRHCHEHYLDNLAAPAGRQAQQAHQSQHDLVTGPTDAGSAHETVIAAATAAHGRATGDLTGTVAALTDDHPGVLAGYDDPGGMVTGQGRRRPPPAYQPGCVGRAPEITKKEQK